MIVNDDIALVHADPEFDPLVHRNVRIALGYRALDSHGGANGLHSAGVFYENSVSGRLDDAAVILGDVGIDDLTPNGFNSAKCATLILAHQPAVADHICHQDRRKPALGVHLMHSRSPLSARQGRQRSLPRGVP